MHLQDKIYKQSPHLLQNMLVTLFDVLQYRKRHGGKYKYWREFHKKNHALSLQALKIQQLELLREFLAFSIKNAPYYYKIINSELLKQDVLQALKAIPIQSKEDIRSNIDDIYTIEKGASILSKTGGTTGKSLEVRFTPDDMQNRFALLDFFRSTYGYQLGRKVAWFSGKSLLGGKDIVRNRYWKYDWYYKIRYYSTFHINSKTIRHYIDDLNKFKPLYAIGFPSSMVEIAKWGIANNYLLRYKMKAIFPTAETIIDSERSILHNFFGGQVVNQYASSEGAPFILECEKGNLHMELSSGFFEVLDAENAPVQKGELVFTSFTTHGTPLIRYAIKDSIELSDKTCDCGNHNPLVERIEGRINDFIYSNERGKINLGNISNCVKYVKGIIKFQMIQSEEDNVLVKVVKDTKYTEKDEEMFAFELKERLGNGVRISFEYVPDIEREASGKYRIVKNSLTIK